MLIALIILGLLISPALAVSHNDAMTFLRDKTPPQVQEKFSRIKIEASPCVVEHGGVVYSLAAVPVRGAQNSFSMAAVRQASLRAAVNLAKYLDGGKTITEGYGDVGAVNHVLLEHYELRAGFSSSGKVINECAFALVSARKINAPISRKDFNTRYCEYLYSEGQALFSSGRYDESARAFRNVHYREWGNVDAYLGASVCLLMMGNNDDAADLAGELVKVFSRDMKPDDIAEAGRILFNAGRKDEGFDVLEHAYNLRR